VSSTEECTKCDSGLIDPKQRQIRLYKNVRWCQSYCSLCQQMFVLWGFCMLLECTISIISGCDGVRIQLLWKSDNFPTSESDRCT